MVQLNGIEIQIDMTSAEFGYMKLSESWRQGRMDSE